VAILSVAHIPGAQPGDQERHLGEWEDVAHMKRLADLIPGPRRPRPWFMRCPIGRLLSLPAVNLFGIPADTSKLSRAWQDKTELAHKPFVADLLIKEINPLPSRESSRNLAWFQAHRDKKDNPLWLFISHI